VAGAVESDVEDFWDASGEDDAVVSGGGDFWDASGEDDAAESGAGVSVAGAVEGSDCVGSFVYCSWEAFPWANAVAPRITAAKAMASVVMTSRPMNWEDNLGRLMMLSLFRAIPTGSLPTRY
jgi:hypothetical protein